MALFKAMDGDSGPNKAKATLRGAKGRSTGRVDIIELDFTFRNHKQSIPLTTLLDWLHDNSGRPAPTDRKDHIACMKQIIQEQLWLEGLGNLKEAVGAVTYVRLVQELTDGVTKTEQEFQREMDESWKPEDESSLPTVVSKSDTTARLTD